MPFAGHSDPTEAQLEWQMMTNLAYGSKGLQYVSLLYPRARQPLTRGFCCPQFCYWSPAGQGPMFTHGGGVYTPRGTMHPTPGQGPMDALKPLYQQGPHYAHALRLNSIVLSFGQ